MTSTAIEFNPFLPEFIADPYPFYHRLRAEAPVHQTPVGWILTRYDDVLMVLRDPRFGRKGFEPLLGALYGSGSDQPGLVTSMLFRDPPDHTRLRGLVNKAFTPRVVERLWPRIQEIVDGLLDDVQDAKRMDVIANFAYPLPVIVICEMLGVPISDRNALRQWSLDIARSLDAIGLQATGMPTGPEVVARGSAARRSLTAYFRDGLLPERRKRPQADLLSALIAAEEQGDKLSEGELLATCNLLFVAGHETTVNLIGNGLLALLRHPDQLAMLRKNPALIESAVEELLRYDGPVQRTARIPNTDVEIDGKKIAQGEMVVALIGAANRDPAHFPDPDRLDITRGATHHIAFGWGIHFCLGAPLARAEAQIAINTLLRRMPRLTSATTTPEWRDTSVLRGLKALPVTF